MKTEARAAALLQLVEGYRDRECRRLQAAAAARAQALLREAHQRARDTLHRHIVDERARAGSLIQAARAEQMTRERRRGERADSALMAAAWPRLLAAMAARWADPATRADWVDGALSQALARLPTRARTAAPIGQMVGQTVGQTVGETVGARVGWQVRHAPDWPVDETAAFVARVTAATGKTPTLAADAGISAGLTIASHGAVLDATAAGLLRDRAAVAARLLALWKGSAPAIEADTPAPGAAVGQPHPPETLR